MFFPIDRFGDTPDGLLAGLLERGLSVSFGLTCEMGQSDGVAFNRPGQHQGHGWHVDPAIEDDSPGPPRSPEEAAELLGAWDDWCEQAGRQYTYPTPTAAALAFLRDWQQFMAQRTQ